uniref:Uncharacterized protein n=1 Tax=Mycena chlorophos TaxID=658473 RepID=A0ABQ0M4P6_MYCCL|nr:predicted protein [Mycena chlorophos]
MQCPSRNSTAEFQGPPFRPRCPEASSQKLRGATLQRRRWLPSTVVLPSRNLESPSALLSSKPSHWEKSLSMSASKVRCLRVHIAESTILPDDLRLTTSAMPRPTLHPTNGRGVELLLRALIQLVVEHRALLQVPRDGRMEELAEDVLALAGSDGYEAVSLGPSREHNRIPETQRKHLLVVVQHELPAAHRIPLAKQRHDHDIATPNLPFLMHQPIPFVDLPQLARREHRAFERSEELAPCKGLHSDRHVAVQPREEKRRTVLVDGNVLQHRIVEQVARHFNLDRSTVDQTHRRGPEAIGDEIDTPAHCFTQREGPAQSKNV